MPGNFNACNSPVGNMHFEGPQNMNQIGSPFMEKMRSLFILTSKGVKRLIIILIILIIIIPSRQLGYHSMQLERHSSAFKISNLSFNASQPARETPDGIR